MATFQRQETIVLSAAVRNSAYTLADPATSMVIRVADPGGTRQVDDTAMTKDATGLYHTDYTPGATAVVGTWNVEYVATDGARVTIKTDTFTLEARPA